MTARLSMVGCLVGPAALTAALLIPVPLSAKPGDRLPDTELNTASTVEAIDFIWAGHRTSPQMIQRGEHQIIVYNDGNVEIPEGFIFDLVRYCWGSAPICNVFEAQQRPFGPFELPVGPG